MKKIGFIGYGSMGKVILDNLLLSQALKSSEIIISTRTVSKLYELKNKYPDIEISQDNCYTALKSNILFLFVGNSDIIDVIEEINEFTSNKTHLVYISAALTIENIKKSFNGKITHIMPSITSQVLEGLSLINHSSSVNPEEKKYLNALFSSIGEVKTIDEQDFDVGAYITSCTPDFIARICMEFAKNVSINNRFSEEEAEEMVIKTLYGTAKLLNEKNMSFVNLINTVATKGGITEEGLKVLDNKLPEIFNELFSTCIEKHAIIQKDLKENY